MPLLPWLHPFLVLLYMHVSTRGFFPISCYATTSPSYAALQIVNNTPALPKSLLAVTPAICPNPCASFALCTVSRVPSRYWHWQSVTGKK